MNLDLAIYYGKNKLRRTATHLGRRIQRKPRIVASLTSYPKRIGTVNVAVQKLLAQKCLPDLIVIYLCKDEFPNREADLPQQLRDQLAHDVQIRWVDDNLKPHKKYFWAMREFAEDLVVTFDDDLLYKNTLIESLVQSYQKHPNCISAIRTHLITFDKEGKILPYSQWKSEFGRTNPEAVGRPSMQLFATTGAGTLYPPHMLPEETFNKEEILELCPIADDVWLKCMELIAGVKVVAATDQQGLEYVPDTQEEALFHINADQGANDTQLINTLNRLRDKLPGDPEKLLHDPQFDTTVR